MTKQCGFFIFIVIALSDLYQRPQEKQSFSKNKRKSLILLEVF
jgi:hypothetical protein